MGIYCEDLNKYLLAILLEWGPAHGWRWQMRAVIAGGLRAGPVLGLGGQGHVHASCGLFAYLEELRPSGTVSPVDSGFEVVFKTIFGAWEMSTFVT